MCLSDPLRRDKAAAQEKVRNSVRKRGYLGSSIEGERSCETRGAHPSLPLPLLACEVQVLKQHGIGESESDLGADFTSSSLPS